MLAAVVGNLLQNAFKFTRPHTTVTLRVGASAERVLIEIEDECGGLPAGNVNGLFRPFEQRSADRTGLGLGLAFSRWGVEANDGRIYARNLPEKGCVFTIDLPRLPRSLAAAPSSTRSGGSELLCTLEIAIPHLHTCISRRIQKSDSCRPLGSPGECRRVSVLACGSVDLLASLALYPLSSCCGCGMTLRLRIGSSP